MTSSNGNIFRVTGHLCGEFTGLRWIPRTKASDAELWCFLWCARLSKHSRGWSFETLSHPLWRHRNGDTDLNTEERNPSVHTFGNRVAQLYSSGQVQYRRIRRIYSIWEIPWWRHQMEALSALLSICAGNSPVTGEFPTQRPVTRSFDVFFDVCLNKRLSKQSWGWWFGTPSRPLWRNCNTAGILPIPNFCYSYDRLLLLRLLLQWLPSPLTHKCVINQALID